MSEVQSPCEGIEKCDLKIQTSGNLLLVLDVQKFGKGKGCLFSSWMWKQIFCVSLILQECLTGNPDFFFFK